MANTQGERKFFRQREKYSLAEIKELGKLDKNVLCFILTPCALQLVETFWLVETFL